MNSNSAKLLILIVSEVVWLRDLQQGVFSKLCNNLLVLTSSFVSLILEIKLYMEHY